MAVTKEEAVDMAWRTEGLVKLLRQKKDPRAENLYQAQITALWNPVLVELSLDVPLEEPTQKQMEDAYCLMESLATEFKYDSGARKYHSL